MIQLAAILGWAPSEVAVLGPAELAAAQREAERQARYPEIPDLLAGLIEQLSALYILTWHGLRAQGAIKRGAKPPDMIEIPRPYDPAAAAKRHQQARRSAGNVKRHVMTPGEAARYIREGAPL